MSGLFSMRPMMDNKEARLSGRKLFKVALSHTWNNKKIFLIPLITGAVGIVGLAFFVLSIFFAFVSGLTGQNGNASTVLGTLVVLMLIFFFVMVFVGVLSEATVLIMADQILGGEEASIKRSFSRAFKSFGSLVVFSIWNMFVGGVIRLLQRGVFTSFISDLVSFAGGLAWAAATYLTLPFVIFENVGPVEATKRGVATIKEKWGQAAAPAVFASGIVMLIYLAGFGLILGPVWVTAYLQLPAEYASPGSYAIYSIVAAGLMLVILAGMLQSGTMAFVKVALYRYVKGMPVEGLHADTLQGAMYSRSAFASRNGLTGTV